MQNGIPDKKTSDLYFSSHDSPTFWKKTQGGVSTWYWTGKRDPCHFVPNSLRAYGNLSEGQLILFGALDVFGFLHHPDVFLVIIVPPDSEDSEESHFYSINTPLCRSNVWSPFGSLPLVTRGIGLRVHKMGAFRSWLWLKIGPKTPRNVWRKRRWI